MDPIPMRLHCGDCGNLHIDEGDFATKPHHTHACQHCGNVWRPAIVATVGVRFLPGFRNEPVTERVQGMIKDIRTMTEEVKTLLYPKDQYCDFKFSSGKPCVSPTCHMDGKHYTEGVVP
jgi:hypothetical protein